MPRPAITTFSSVAVKPVSTNNNNGLYAPQLTAAQIAKIPETTLQNGFIAYDTDDDRLKTCVGGIVQQINTGVGVGDVVGPGGSVFGNIAVFADATGKLIDDSGVNIAQVAPPPLPFIDGFNALEAPSVFVNEIGNLGNIKFTNGTGFIFVDALSPVGFYLNDFGPDSQICSVFTGGIAGLGTTNPSCLVELNSTTGALVLSRLDTEEIEELFATPGMILFNASSNRLNYHNGTDWIDSGGIELIGAVTGDGAGIIDTTLASTITCTDIMQTFIGNNGGTFGLNVSNSLDIDTYMEISTIGARKFNLIYKPTGDLGNPLNIIDSPAIPFALGSFGTVQFFKDATGNIGIGTSTPHSLLHFSNSPNVRKITLREVGNNDHEFFGFGNSLGILHHQVPSTSTDHVFYAGINSTTSTELFRVAGTGFVGIGNSIPHAPLHFSDLPNTKKIILREISQNAHQFFGFGANLSEVRYQVADTTNNHVFYAGVDAITSNELARITGDGNIEAAADIIANGTIYGMRPSGTLFATSGSPFTTVTGDNWTKISATMISMGSTNLFSTGVNNRLTYTGSPSISILTILDVSLTANVINTNYSISIYKNGVMILGSNTPMTALTLGYNIVSTNGRTTLNNGDYIEAWIRSNRNENVATATVILSVIAT